MMFFSRNQRFEAKAKAKRVRQQLMRVLLIEEGVRSSTKKEQVKAKLLEEAYDLRRTLVRYYCRYRRIAKGYRPFDTTLSPKDLA